jgi:hypothetical protein
MLYATLITDRMPLSFSLADLELARKNFIAAILRRDIRSHANNNRMYYSHELIHFNSETQIEYPAHIDMVSDYDVSRITNSTVVISVDLDDDIE